MFRRYGKERSILYKSLLSQLPLPILHVVKERKQGYILCISKVSLDQWGSIVLKIVWYKYWYYMPYEGQRIQWANAYRPVILIIDENN